ncbi:MAG: DUF5680 domain-containing protein [bacterium]
MKEYGMEIPNLEYFINFAKREGYPSEMNPASLKDGGKEYEIYVTDPQKGTFGYSDIFYGYNPFYGKEEIWHNGKKIWVMQYFGICYDPDYKKVYDFLKLALKNSARISCLRGPAKFQKSDSDLIYTSESSANWFSEIFSGKEEIRRLGKQIYMLNFQGGKLINPGKSE